jgi:hypothetical protein
MLLVRNKIVLPCSKKVMVKGDKDTLVKLHSAGLGGRYGYGGNLMGLCISLIEVFSLFFLSFEIALWVDCTSWCIVG